MFKKLVISAALGLSTFAAAAPHQPGGFGPSPVHGAAPVSAVRADRFDVEQGRRLLRELEQVHGRRDGFALRRLDAQVLSFMQSELMESRRDARGPMRRDERREERSSARQLTRLMAAYERLQGSFDRSSVRERRELLRDAVRVAERDLFARR